MIFIYEDGTFQSGRFRAKRLLDVLEFVHGLAPGRRVFDTVESLEDQKGTLVVRWRHPEPTEEQKTLFHVAWATVGHEQYEYVKHEILPEKGDEGAP